MLKYYTISECHGVPVLAGLANKSAAALSSLLMPCNTLQAQACLLAHAWEVGVEGLPGCGREIIQGASHSFTVSGPRAKMGLVVGTPTRVCPHTTSGGLLHQSPSHPPHPHPGLPSAFPTPSPPTHPSASRLSCNHLPKSCQRYLKAGHDCQADDCPLCLVSFLHVEVANAC